VNLGLEVPSLCPVCGGYWVGCGHWDGPPMPLQAPNYANFDLITEGGTVQGFDLVAEPLTDATAVNWEVL
jgi:hypothetical protein